MVSFGLQVLDRAIQGARHRFWPACTCAIVFCPVMPDSAHRHVNKTCRQSQCSHAQYQGIARQYQLITAADSLLGRVPVHVQLKLVNNKVLPLVKV